MRPPETTGRPPNPSPGIRRHTRPIPRPSNPGRANSIASLKLRGDEHVLDVGCGDGKVTAEIARALPKGAVTGVDASASMIRFARARFAPPRFPNLDFQVMDARRIRLPENFRHRFLKLGAALGGRSSAFLRGAPRVCGPADAWSFPAAARATPRRCSWRSVLKCAGDTGASSFARWTSPISFTRQTTTGNGCRDADSKCGACAWRPRTPPTRAAQVLRPGCAQHGSPTPSESRNDARGVRRRHRGPLHGQTSARTRPAAFASGWCGWRSTRLNAEPALLNKS